MNEAVKKDILKYFDNGIIYPISTSARVSHVQVVPKKSESTIIQNEANKVIPTCGEFALPTKNLMPHKGLLSLLFTNQILERLAIHEFYCF